MSFNTAGWGNASNVIEEQESGRDRGFDNVLTSIKDGASVANDTLCLIWPRRPGCPGDPNRAPDTVIQNFGSDGSGIWLYLLLAIVLIVALVFLLKR